MPIPSDPTTTTYWFDPGLVLDSRTLLPIASAAGYFYATRADALAATNRLPVTDAAGTVLPQLTSSYVGVCPAFGAPLPRGFVDFGAGPQEVISGQTILEQLALVTAKVGVDLAVATDAAATARATSDQNTTDLAALSARVDALSAGGYTPGGGSSDGFGDGFTDTFSDGFTSSGTTGSGGAADPFPDSF